MSRAGMSMAVKTPELKQPHVIFGISLTCIGDGGLRSFSRPPKDLTIQTWKMNEKVRKERTRLRK